MFKLALLFMINSCAFLIDKIDSPLLSEIPENKNLPSTESFCALKNKADFQLIGSGPNSQTVYLELIKESETKLDFLDHFALWNLLQLSIRPDQTSATSRLQVMLRQDNNSYYFDFFSEEKENQYPFLYGLEQILIKFGKKTSLEQYARILQSPKIKKLKIDKEFERFLLKNLNSIKDNPDLAPFYFRGADVLKENETLPQLNYEALLKIYRSAKKQQKIIINTSLVPFVTNKGSIGSCNYDFNLYDNSIFLIDQDIPVSNFYGLANTKSAFLSSASQKLEKFESLKGLPLFKGESKVRSSAVCMIENKGNKIWAFSNQSRDPGQHLFHLVRYGLPNSTTTAQVDKLIRHSRHLFLSDPVRLVIESARSSQEQIENLLKLNLPIYNADNLGNIWAYTQFQEGHRFIIDDRNAGAFLCK